MTAVKHFVTFYSPGTFVAEATTKEVPGWDVDAAVKMAEGIEERYGSRPYGFRFTTRSRGDDDFEPRETAQSPMHYLGGVVRTLEEVEADNRPDEEILRTNMRGNGYRRIITTETPWRWTQPLDDDAVVLAA